MKNRSEFVRQAQIIQNEILSCPRKLDSGERFTRVYALIIIIYDIRHPNPETEIFTHMHGNNFGVTFFLEDLLLPDPALPAFQSTDTPAN